MLFINADGGGVGGVDISMICWVVDIGFAEGNDESNGGDIEGEGGRGSINVLNVWLIEFNEHLYAWSNSIDSNGLNFPPVLIDDDDGDRLELFTW